MMNCRHFNNKNNWATITFFIIIGILTSRTTSQHSSTLSFEPRRQNGACKFRGVKTTGKLLRVDEDLPVGSEILRVVAYPRHQFLLQALDGSRADGYFTFRELDRRRVSIILDRSLQDLVDQPYPTTSLQFRLACKGLDDATDYLPVSVYINDINDHSPEFVNAPYNVTIDEGTPQGLTIFRGISALDKDKPNGANSELSYSIVRGNEDKKFSIEGTSKTSVLVLRKKLDYDSGDKLFNLTIRAEDKGTPPRSSITHVTIYVTDDDDQNPAFTANLYRTKIKENNPITGHQIQEQLVFDPPLEAFDQDRQINTPLHFRIVSGNDDGFFSIDPATGHLYQVKEIDYEELDNGVITMQIEAAQKNNPVKAATAVVEVEIEDVNDNIPRFSLEDYNLTLVENLPRGFEIMKFLATDRDKGENGRFFYRLNDPSNTFALDPKSGTLSLANPDNLDREKHGKFVMEIWATEVGALDARRGSKVRVVVNIEDENDNAPIFTPSSEYTFPIPSNPISNFRLGSVRATDPDQGLNGLVRYRMKEVGSRLGDIFSIDAVTGDIKLKSRQLFLQTEIKRFSFVVVASDQAESLSNQKSSEAHVVIVVVDEDQLVHNQNHNIPKRSTPIPPSLPIKKGDFNVRFPEVVQVFNVSRSGRRGKTIGQMEIYNPEDLNLRWIMRHRYRKGVPFGIDRKGGKIGLVRDIDNDALDHYLLKVQAQFKGGEAVTEIRINILNETSESEAFSNSPDLSAKDMDQAEEESGEALLGKNHVFHVKENLEGSIITNLSLFSNFQNAKNGYTEYFITHDEDAKQRFAISESGLLYTKVGLDREVRNNYEMIIVNGRGILRGKDTVQVRVLVDDENDNSPSFDRHIYQGSIFRSASPGTKVKLGSVIRVSDPDLNDKVSLKLLGKWSSLFKLDQESGEVFLAEESNIKRSLPQEKIYLRIRATDKDDHITESQLVVHVLEQKLDSPPEVRGLAVINAGYVTLSGSDTLVVKETTPVGTRLARIMATDETSNLSNFTLKFKIESEEVLNLRNPRTRVESLLKSSRNIKSSNFKIGPDSGDIILTRSISPAFKFILNVSISDENDMLTSTGIVIEVEEVNMHKPKFEKDHYVFEIVEDTYKRHFLGSVRATDADKGFSGVVQYKTSDETLPFQIDPISGDLFVNGVITHSKSLPDIHFEVIATDQALKLPNQSSVNVTVNIQSSNPDSPTFFGHKKLRNIKAIDDIVRLVPDILDDGPKIVPVYTAEFDEETQALELAANDSQSGDQVTFSLIDGEDFAKLDSKTGELTLKKPVSEIKGLQNHELIVAATDDGKPAKSSYAIIQISVLGRTSTSAPSTIKETLSNTVAIRSTTTAPTTSKSTTATTNMVPTAVITEKTAHLPLFSKKSVRVDVVENLRVPAKIIDLLSLINNRNELSPKFRISSESYGMFQIDPKTGYLMLLSSPDREIREEYDIKVFGVPDRDGGSTGSDSIGVPVLFYTVHINENGGRQVLEGDEILIKIKILDENDNTPEFLTSENPKRISVSSDIKVGEMIGKLEAWDADIGENGAIRYILSTPTKYFAIDSKTGDLRVQNPLTSEGGKTFRLKVEARDMSGSKRGLSSTIHLMIHIVDVRHQIKMVLNNAVSDVLRDSRNITKILSDISGLDIHPHVIEKHREVFSNEIHSDAMTDIYIYGVDSNSLVDTDRMIRSLSPQLPLTKSKLSPHELVEVQAGSLVFSPDDSQLKSDQDSTADSSGDQFVPGIGYWQIIILVMAAVVFIGALIALGTICSLKYKRVQTTKYPAPLAIPLAPGNPPPQGHMGQNLTLTPVSILHPGDPRRLSVKSYHSSKSQRKVYQSQIDSSEDTSDTCIDDQANARSKSRESLHKKRPWQKTKDGWVKDTRSDNSARDSGISGESNRRDSDGLCQHSINSSCDSCADCLLESRAHTYSHFAQHPSHLSHRRISRRMGLDHRRHQSASPHRQRRKSVGLAESIVPNVGTPSRSRSAGHEKEDCQHCHRCCCTSMTKCSHSVYYDWGVQRHQPRCRSARSTRWEVYQDWGNMAMARRDSKHVRKSMSYDKNYIYNYIDDYDEDDDDDENDGEIDEDEARTDRHLRLASSNAEKSQSWRGDNPLRKNRIGHQTGGGHHYFEHEARKPQQILQDPARISLPFRTNYAYEASTAKNPEKMKNGTSNAPTNGIKLVGLAPES